MAAQEGRRTAQTGQGRLSGVGFLPKEEQSRHSRESGNPEIPPYTGQSAWMPACAGMTDRRDQAYGKPVTIAGDEKKSNLPSEAALAPTQRLQHFQGRREEIGPGHRLRILHEMIVQTVTRGSHHPP